MDSPTLVVWLAIALIVLLGVLTVAIVMAVRILGRLADRLEVALGRLQQDVTATLRQAHDTLERIERVAQSSDQLLREEVAPTLELTRSTIEHVEGSVRGVSESVNGVQRIVRGILAVSGPGAMAVITRRIYKQGGKLGLVAMGLGAGLRALLGDDRRQRRFQSRRYSDGTRR
jgi:uncharacterized protein YoxC